MSLNFNHIEVTAPPEAEEAILRVGQEIMDYVKRLPAVSDVALRKEGEWEMFDLITSTYYGKGMYFRQRDNIVYSRYSCGYMTVDDAITEFLKLIGDDGDE